MLFRGKIWEGRGFGDRFGIVEVILVVHVHLDMLRGKKPRTL